MKPQRYDSVWWCVVRERYIVKSRCHQHAWGASNGPRLLDHRFCGYLAVPIWDEDERTAPAGGGRSSATYMRKECMGAAIVAQARYSDNALRRLACSLRSALGRAGVGTHPNPSKSTGSHIRSLAGVPA